MLSEKKTSLKRLHIVQFHLQKIFKITKVQEWRTDFPEVKDSRKDLVWLQMERLREPHGDGTVLYLERGGSYKNLYIISCIGRSHTHIYTHTHE